MIADADQRAAALDTRQSFCVGAPAGSGKTELLIQRYLALLARVQNPEQVLAITFTRKAAAEMRERIVAALMAAKERQPCKGDHEITTRALADAVLEHDQTLGWNLLDSIVRVNVKTIDSFCATLTRQMPVLSSFGGQAAVTEDAGDLYIEAVQSLFAGLDSDSPAMADLKALLLHFDNNWERMQELLVTMLARRDQWRDYVGVHHTPDESESYLRQLVDQVVAESLEAIKRDLASYEGALVELLNYQAANIGLGELDQFPVPVAADLPLWRRLRDLLLTAGGTWRAAVDARMGFPAQAGEANLRRDTLKELIAELRGIEGLETRLAELSYLPEIGDDNPSWQLVLHLSRVLPLLAANLLVVFQQQGLVDHGQVAMSALEALGDDERPTDLAMRLDYAIDHILVDEFQDTAINQYELVRRLTRGWREFNESQPDNPRTLFIVGDGMQSIYGFRDANVSLFLQARDQGFNGLRLASLQLTSNFRSQAGLVEWVNETFQSAFPQEDDVARGRIAFSPARAIKSATAAPPVLMQSFVGEDTVGQEAAYIADQVADGLTNTDCHSIAILGRTRNQLQPVLAALRERGIAYAAQDIDVLAGAPVIVDMMNLCCAMANRYDRLSWLAVLRAPWCGLQLDDLLVVARWQDASRHTVVKDSMAAPGLMNALSDEGKKRCLHVVNAVAWADSQRDRLALRVWIEQLWLRLGGPSTVEQDGELADAEQFFRLLERADCEGLGLDVRWLRDQLDRLYAHPGPSDARVQVMTLHKAKGLEFDWVIIPDLARQARSDSRDLLLWDERASDSGEREFLLAADDHSDKAAPSLYNYLRAERKRKGLLENTRLLYVGATRAVDRLVLTARLAMDERKGAPKKPGDSTLLASIWPVFEASTAILESTSERATVTGVHRLSRVRDIPEPHIAATQAESGGEADNVPPARHNREERFVGTTVHRLLEVLSLQTVLPDSCGERERSLSLFTLRQLGLSGEGLDRAQSRVLDAVNAALADRECGRWLMSSEHLDASSELALTRVDEAGNVGNIIIDRTFIDAATGVRWIIDYKTSRPATGEGLSAFLAREEAAYRDQLTTYATALRSLGRETIRAALYFPGLDCLHTVELSA